MFYSLIYNIVVLTTLSNLIVSLEQLSLSTTTQTLIPVILELSIDKTKLVDGHSGITIDRVIFSDLLIQEIEKNLVFFHNGLQVDIYFYNRTTTGPCDEESYACDGVQIEMKTNSPLYSGERKFRYEIGN